MASATQASTSAPTTSSQESSDATDTPKLPQFDGAGDEASEEHQQTEKEASETEGEAAGENGAASNGDVSAEVPSTDFANDADVSCVI